MDQLFEAKALVNDQYLLFSIDRISTNEYKATSIADQSAETVHMAPTELILAKENGEWKTENKQLHELATTLGSEIDAFNSGYGDLLGRIGID